MRPDHGHWTLNLSNQSTAQSFSTLVFYLCSFTAQEKIKNLVIIGTEQRIAY